MTSKLTRERIELIANFHRAMTLPPSHTEIEELARIALATMDGEPDRNPVLAYADSYRDMAKQGVESVPIWSVITDLERNIAPLYRHAQPVTVVPEEKPIPNTLSMYAVDAVAAIAEVKGWNACRAAILSAAPHDTPALNSVQSVVTVPGKWIPVSERMPDEGGRYLAWVQQQNDLGLSQWADNVGYHPDSLGFRVTGRVTHWMPLPAAPQEPKP